MDTEVFEYDWEETKDSFNYENEIRKLILTDEKAEPKFLEERISFFNSEIDKINSITDEELKNYISDKIQELSEYRKASIDDKKEMIDFEVNLHKDMFESKMKMCNNYILDYELKISRLPKSLKKELKNKGLPYKIALLDKIGFFNLPTIKNLTKENQRKVVIELIGGSDRQVKGNISVLNPNSNDDQLRYTSYNFTGKVTKFLQKISN